MLRAVPRSRLPRTAQTLWFLLDPTGFLDAGAARHGPVFEARTWMYDDALVVGDAASIRDVVAGDPELFRGGDANSFLRPVVGARSVSCLDGAEHGARRRLLMPVLQRAATGLAPAAQEIAERAFEGAPFGKPISVQRLMRRITLEIALHVVIGRSQAHLRRAIGNALTRLVDRGTVPFSQLGAMPALQRDWGPFSPWGAFRRDVERLDALVFEVIDARRNTAAHVEEFDALDGLLAAGDGGRALSKLELRDDVVTLIGAAHDTTATALAWTIDRLLAHPVAMSRVEGELSNLDRPASSEMSRGAAPYLDAVIHETLRQRPVLPTFSRIAGGEVSVAGARVRKGTRIMLCPHLAHQDPESFHDPARFEPERFLQGRPSSYAFLPFGGGGRRCPGASIALEQMRVVLGAFLSRFEIERAYPSSTRPIFRGSTLAPADGTRAVLHARH